MFAPFDGYPLVCALARDMNTKLLWCNDEYARTVGKPKDQLLGTTLHDIMRAEAATERIELMWDVLKTGHPGAYFQVWHDRRYMTAIWRLDPAAFGCDGAFIVLTRGFGEREPDVIDYDHLNVTTTPHFDKLDKLSRRELEVLYYAALGLTSEEISKRLFRAVKTVENHLASITQKMGFKGEPNWSASPPPAASSPSPSTSGSSWRPTRSPPPVTEQLRPACAAASARRPRQRARWPRAWAPARP
jgi:DNA-binding CsgD family transcriptional regulator